MTQPSVADLIERLTNGRDVPSRQEAAERIQRDAETIKRLLYALNRVREMADNASYRIGSPRFQTDDASLQQGFNDISAEAKEGLDQCKN